MFVFGAGTKSRTRDLLITSQLLYQLSYTGLSGAHITVTLAYRQPFFLFFSTSYARHCMCPTQGLKDAHQCHKNVTIPVNKTQ